MNHQTAFGADKEELISDGENSHFGKWPIRTGTQGHPSSVLYFY